MEGLLKCPHGLVTGCEERQGLKIYRHLQDGEACGLLNGLQLTPEEILLEMGQTFVSSDNFTALAPVSFNILPAFLTASIVETW